MTSWNYSIVDRMVYTIEKESLFCYGFLMSCYFISTQIFCLTCGRVEPTLIQGVIALTITLSFVAKRRLPLAMVGAALVFYAFFIPHLQSLIG